MEKKSVILPDDIPVKTDIHQVFLSNRVTDLAASILLFPPDPLEMGVTPPRRLGFVDITEIRRKIRATRRKVNQLLKKYEEKI